MEAHTTFAKLGAGTFRCELLEVSKEASRLPPPRQAHNVIEKVAILAQLGDDHARRPS